MKTKKKKVLMLWLEAYKWDRKRSTHCRRQHYTEVDSNSQLHFLIALFPKLPLVLGVQEDGQASQTIQTLSS